MKRILKSNILKPYQQTTKSNENYPACKESTIHFLCGLCILKTVMTQIKGRIPSGVSEYLCFTPHQQPRTGISLGSTRFAKNNLHGQKYIRN